MIRFENVSKSYQNSPNAVEDLSFQIREAEIFGILGESGAGKSSVLKLINQIEKQDQGKIYIQGKDVQKLDAKSLRDLRKEIGVIFQSYNLLYNKTVYDNIVLPLRLRKIPNEKQKVLEALDFVGLCHKQNHYPKELSGGEAQRVAIARALVTRPKILLCDEPTSALDQKTSKEILKLLKRIQRDFQTSIVFVSHELSAAKAICDRVAVMQQGKLQGIIDVKKQESIENEQSYFEMVSEVMHL